MLLWKERYAFCIFITMLTLFTSETVVHYIFCFIPEGLKTLYKGTWNMTRCCNPGSVHLGTIGIWGQIVAGGCPVPCRVVRQHPWLLPTRCQYHPSFSCDNPKGLHLLPMSPGRRTENENHPLLRICGINLEVGQKTMSH